ncbi:DUF6254 family protein [Paenibacillus sp. NPDC056579]|nr:DUF6254 family protein [Paenibacillus sp. H1-7]
MSKQKNRRENADKIRKQTHRPHGYVKSLEEYAEEYESGQSANKKQ